MAKSDTEFKSHKSYSSINYTERDDTWKAVNSVVSNAVRYALNNGKLEDFFKKNYVGDENFLQYWSMTTDGTYTGINKSDGSIPYASMIHFRFRRGKRSDETGMGWLIMDREGNLSLRAKDHRIVRNDQMDPDETMVEKPVIHGSSDVYKEFVKLENGLFPPADKSI